MKELLLKIDKFLAGLQDQQRDRPGDVSQVMHDDRSNSLVMEVVANLTEIGHLRDKIKAQVDAIQEGKNITLTLETHKRLSKMNTALIYWQNTYFSSFGQCQNVLKEVDGLRKVVIADKKNSNAKVH